ncbi:hypothetical protein O987_09600 [Comamonas testosteroni TK102]|uniref:Uncharacterized protein n=1 Tax=Comamonas testosteroni TK102 TaxID=1392005 RepID=A0A076PQX0_COMTE|nr:hypothetical protein O987_09600 [Comamonas testosteroni TK102]
MWPDIGLQKRNVFLLESAFKPPQLAEVFRIDTQYRLLLKTSQREVPQLDSRQG